MEHQIIDCCALLNLYTGWDSLEPLKTLGISLHISDAVLGESFYINEFDSAGNKVKKALDLRSMQPTLGYAIVRPDTPDEVSDYVEFAMEIDDGEAQSLAIAKHRNLILLSDDKKALGLANRPDVSVRTITTVQILRLWCDDSASNAQRLPLVLQRISELARFRPSARSPERVWWDTHTS